MAKKSVKLNVIGKKFVTRCSYLPLLFSCPNAIRNPDRLLPVRVEFDAADLGTDIHSAIQHTIETGDIDFRKIEAKYTPENIQRAKELFATGIKTVEEAKRDMKNPLFEQEVSFESESFVVSGHVDVLDADAHRAFIVDFKTGRTRDDHYHQMLGYAVGAWTKMGRPEKYAVHVAYVYLESGEVTTIDLTTADLKSWLKELDSLPVQYQINRRCVYCPFNNTCPAFRDYLKGSLSLLLGIAKLPEVRIRRLDAAARAKLATAMKMGRFAIDRIRDYVKQDAIAHGDISLGNGDKFTIKTRENRLLLTSRALPVIAKYVSAKDISNATKLCLPSLVTAAARRVKGSMRKVIREEMIQRLKEAGAILVSESAYLETVVESKCQPKKKIVRPAPHRK